MELKRKRFIIVSLVKLKLTKYKLYNSLISIVTNQINKISISVGSSITQRSLSKISFFANLGYIFTQSTIKSHFLSQPLPVTTYACCVSITHNYGNLGT